MSVGRVRRYRAASSTPTLLSGQSLAAEGFYRLPRIPGISLLYYPQQVHYVLFRGTEQNYLGSPTLGAASLPLWFCRSSTCSAVPGVRSGREDLEKP